MESVEVVYEDNHLLVVNKPGGMLVQGDRTGDKSLMDWGKNYVKKKYDKPGNVFLGLPHRIDRVTSGLVILCRTSKSLTRVTKGFREKIYQKNYLAIIPLSTSLDQEAVWTDRMIKSNENNKSYIIKSRENAQWEKAKEAISKYKLMATSGDCALINVELKTGRHHQIRVQTSSRKLPILGDMKYGSKKGYGHYIALHAWKISGMHPVTKMHFDFMANPPNLTPWIRFESYIK